MRYAAKDYKNYIFTNNINPPGTEETEQEVITIDDKTIDKNITEEFDKTQLTTEQETITIKDENDKLIDDDDDDESSIKINSIIEEKINDNSENNDKEKDEFHDEQIEKESGYLRYFFLTRLFA